MARLMDQLIGHRETLRPLFWARAKNSLAGSLLFAGPSGIGKKKSAMALIQLLVCESAVLSKGEGVLVACGECGHCLRIENQQSESLYVVQPSGNQIKIEQIREVLKFLSLRSLGRARVVLIDQAHLMNPQAANALLKSLEEPPQDTHFILISQQPTSLLATIRSRTQLVRFKPLSHDELKKVIQEFPKSIDDPPFEEWMIAAAQGSVESVMRLRDLGESLQELERTTVDYIFSAQNGLPSGEMNSLKDRLKDRAVQGVFVVLLQGLINEAMKLQAGVAVSAEYKSREVLIAAVKKLADIRGENLRTLADLSIELEQDLNRNVDRSLILENFAIQLKAAAH